MECREPVGYLVFARYGPPTRAVVAVVDLDRSRRGDAGIVACATALPGVDHPTSGDDRMTFTLPDPSTEFGARVARELREDMIAWVTSVDRAGTPQPAPVWFLWENDTALFYSRPDAKRLDRLKANPRTSLNLNDEGLGKEVLVLTGTLTREDGIAPAHLHEAFTAKYGELAADAFGSHEKFSELYSVPLVFHPERVRGH
ncbi:TIGR03667 family PPOX class F420-dependent oxidoreductase [Actinosynnema sp. NPDC023587]|uniref:TIGR03667 family PPOX class F420-dependent oxidoreductase n=1 Tax=Actinosynnema sp. NPDC023587 TaxID=3154695 RepID=UPI00340371FC